MTPPGDIALHGKGDTAEAAEDAARDAWEHAVKRPGSARRSRRRAFAVAREPVAPRIAHAQHQRCC